MNDAYNIAVKIALVENVTRGLAMMSRHFRTTDMEAKALETRLKSIGKMALVGGAFAGAGAFGLGLFKAPLEEAKRYQVEMTKITSLGLGAGVTAHADQFARAANVIGNSARDMAAHYGDALAVFKDAHEADMVAPVLGKMAFANATLFGAGGPSRDRALMDLMKVIEFRGGTRSEAEFMAQADMAQRVVNASRGRVDGGQMLQAMKSGGLLAKQMSNQAFYLAGEPLIQEMGGFRYGTGLNAVYGNLAQGRGSITAQQEMLRLGLLDPSKVEFNNQGRLKKAMPGAFTGMDALIEGGPLGLLNKVLLPAFAKAGITDPKAIQQEIGMVFSNSRAAALIGAAYQQRGKLGIQEAANAKALGVAGTTDLAGRTTTGKEADLEAKANTLKMQIGQAIMPAYVKGLEMLRDTIMSISRFASANPGAFKAIIGLFAAVSAAALVGGGLSLLVAGFRGLMLLAPLFRGVSVGFTILRAAFPYLIGGLRVLAGVLGVTGGVVIAIGLLIYNNWAEIKASLIKIWGDMKTAVIQLFHGDILGALKTWGVAMARGFQIIFNTLIAGVNSIMPSAMALSKFHFADDLAAMNGPKVPMGAAARGGQGHGTVYLDGAKVGHIITQHQSRQASRPQTGGNSFDWSRARPSVGMIGK